MNKQNLMVSDQWRFGEVYCYKEKEDCVRSAKKARNEGFRVDFIVNEETDFRYAFKLVDPFEGMEYSGD